MDIRELHEKAMKLASLADLQKIQGNKESAVSLYEESYFLEYEAAMNAYNGKVGEPSVSVLLRSAASLAVSCKKFREAEKLISLALGGNPPSEIADELKNLLETIYSHRSKGFGKYWDERFYTAGYRKNKKDKVLAGIDEQEE